MSGSGEGAGTRVVHLIGSLDVGGAEVVALDLCQRIPAHLVHQTFVCLSGREGALAAEFRAAGAEVVALSLRSLGTPFHLWRLFRQGRGADPVEPVDTVVSHVSLASGPLLLWARACRVPRRTARFHSQGDGRGHGLVRRLYRAVARVLVAFNATHVFGVTESSIEFGLGRARRVAQRRGVEVRVIPNGVDPVRFAPRSTPLAGGPLVVLHVGRASPEKNRAFLGPLVRALRVEGAAEVRLVGSTDTTDLGPYAAELTVVGPVRDVAGQLRQAHVLVLPSVWEGLPTVVLEALACGVPVVSNDLPGVREIADRVTGVELLPVDASPSIWAGKVRSAAQTDPSAVREAFLRSPFTIDRSVTAWTRHLTGLPQRGIRPTAGDDR